MGGARGECGYGASVTCSTWAAPAVLLAPSDARDAQCFDSSGRHEPKRTSRASRCDGMDLSQQAFAMELETAHDAAGCGAGAIITVWDGPVENSTRERRRSFPGVSSVSPHTPHLRAAPNAPGSLARRDSRDAVSLARRDSVGSLARRDSRDKPVGFLQSAAALFASLRSSGCRANQAGGSGRKKAGAGGAGTPQAGGALVTTAQRNRAIGAPALHGGFVRADVEGGREVVDARERSASRSRAAPWATLS